LFFELRVFSRKKRVRFSSLFPFLPFFHHRRLSLSSFFVFLFPLFILFFSLTMPLSVDPT